MESPVWMLGVLESPLLVPFLLFLLIPTSCSTSLLCCCGLLLILKLCSVFFSQACHASCKAEELLWGCRPCSAVPVSLAPNLLLREAQVFVLQGKALSRCERVCNRFSWSFSWGCLRTCLVNPEKSPYSGA